MDEKSQMFRNNAVRHLWSEYMMLMRSEKQDEDEDKSSCGEELESTILCIARLDEWIMTVLEVLGVKENRG